MVAHLALSDLLSELVLLFSLVGFLLGLNILESLLMNLVTPLVMRVYTSADRGPRRDSLQCNGDRSYFITSLILQLIK